MDIPALIRTLLERQRIDYTPLEASRDLNGAPNLAGCTVFASERGLVLTICPAHHRINLETLEAITRRRLQFIDVEGAQRVLARATAKGKLPFGTQLIIDSHLSNQDTIAFAGEPNPFFVAMGQLLLLDNDTLIGSAFSEPRQGQEDIPGNGPRLDLRERLGEFEALAPMPDVAQRILWLSADPEAGIVELTDLIEQDPALPAQVLCYANSALFGQKGQIKTLDEAIVRVLGYDNALCLAMGLATARGFPLPQNGPLGTQNLWQHGVYCAALTQRLASHVPRWGRHRPRPAIAYLAGLLHDIGVLVLGKVFMPEYFWLSKLTRAGPDTPLATLERQLLGVSHAELSELQLRHWGLPEEIAVAVAHHHDEDYTGPHAVYAQLVLLSDRLLKSQALSDADTGALPQAVLARLGLGEEQALAALDALLEDADTLRAMAHQLTA